LACGRTTTIPRWYSRENYINDNDAEGIVYEISYNFAIQNNSLVGNAVEQGSAVGVHFPVGAIYVSESGGSGEAGVEHVISEIHHNFLANNWDGVVLWESGNRYAGTDGDGYRPAYGGERWKTQNVLVHHNEFRMDKGHVGCAGNPYCGRNGLFSERVPVPGPPESLNSSGDFFLVSVTFEQGNVFADNQYVGEWSFVAFDKSAQYDWQTWRAPQPPDVASIDYLSPLPHGFGLDAGSRMS
jgi:hypothetical protein